MSRRNRRHEMGVGILLLVGLAIFSFLAVQVDAFHVDRGTIRLYALLDNAAGLNEGAVVAVAGVDVGRITALAVEGAQARVDLVLDDEIEPRQDAILKIRARSVLGEKYLELDPGSPTSPLLLDGERISRTQGQVELDQMVTSMGPLLDAANPGALAEAIDHLSRLVNEDPQRLETISSDAQALLHNLRVASESAPGLVKQADATLARISAMVEETEPLLARTDHLLRQVEGLMEPLDAAAQDLPGATDELTIVLRDTRQILQVVNASSRDLAQVLANLKEIDKWELRRLLREEGVFLRFRAHEVVPDDAAPDGSGGSK